LRERPKGGNSRVGDGRKTGGRFGCAVREKHPVRDGERAGIWASNRHEGKKEEVKGNPREGDENPSERPL